MQRLARVASTFGLIVELSRPFDCVPLKEKSRCVFFRLGIAFSYVAFVEIGGTSREPRKFRGTLRCPKHFNAIKQFSNDKD